MRARTPVVGRLVGLAMILAGLGTAAVATPPEAAAATTRPTAIGVAPNGTSYVGFATGGRLQRVNAAGHRDGTVALDQDEAVDGLFVNRSGDIWVDYATSVSLLGPQGQVRRHFDHDPATTCDSSVSPTRYGGVTVADSRVYVANRCSKTLSVYSTGGLLLATVSLPGRPRGVAYGVAQSGHPAFVYVAVPDRGQVLAFRASSLRSSSQPASRYTLKRPRGGSSPEPGGVVVDRHGQLTVTDMANNALYLVNTNYRYSLYRTLGHPPRASGKLGRLRTPGALAQYPQDGGGLSANYFVLDTDNSRVQRWSNGGYAYWGKTVLPGADSGGGDGGGDAPQNTVPPSISGTAAVGNTLTCAKGSWSGGSSIAYSYSWRRDGATISGATSATYVVVGADAGASLTCRVTAANGSGSTTATSAAVTVADTGGPTNLTAPSISGTALPGGVLACDPGTWSGSGITYSYAWRRNGTTVGAGSTYTVVSDDVGTSFTCAVTASNSNGTTTATSGAVTISGPSGHAPANTASPTISGTPAVGQTLTCSTGSWSGSPTSYAYLWRRNGTSISGATASTYVVVGADAGTSLSCTVVATNGYGSGAATSATVSVPDAIAPSNTSLPTTSGSAAVGTALTCDQGGWSGSGLTYRYSWRRDGTPIADTDDSRYVVLSADQGTSLTCAVTARNSAGSATAVSSGRGVPAVAGGSPTVVTAPSISGTVGTGQELTCSVGSWTGSPTSYAVVWQRDGATIATGTGYTQTADDTDHALRCLVVATNATGRGAARSEAVGSSGCGSTTGVLINDGAAETTDPDVELTITPPAGATTITVSNNASMAGATSYPVSVGCTVPWTMDSIPGLPLSWSVYVQFDNDASTYSDDIVIRQAAARTVLRLW